MVIHILYLLAEESRVKLGNATLGIGIAIAIALVCSFVASLPIPGLNIMLVFLLLLFFSLGVPIAISLALLTVIAFSSLGDFPMTVIPQRMFVGLDSFTLMAVPFFMLAGAIMHAGGIALRLVNFASFWSAGFAADSFRRMYWPVLFLPICLGRQPPILLQLVM